LSTDPSPENITYAAFVRLVIDALLEAQVDYMIGGALAAWAWAQPRSTIDLDLILNVLPESVVPLSNALEKRGMLLPEDIIINFLVNQWPDSPLNIHHPGGYKADLYLIFPQDELRNSAFARRREYQYEQPIGKVWVHAPDDLIIYILDRPPGAAFCLGGNIG
jgi:hypothetical protein